MSASTTQEKTQYENMLVFPVRGTGPRKMISELRGIVYARMALWQDVSGAIPEGENNWRIGEVYGPGTGPLEGVYTPVNNNQPGEPAGVTFDQSLSHRPYPLVVGEVTSTGMQIAFGSLKDVPEAALAHLDENFRNFVGSLVGNEPVGYRPGDLLGCGN